MLGQRQVKPGWMDDHVRKQGGRWWRGRWGRRGMPPPGRSLDGGKRGLGWSIISM